MIIRLNEEELKRELAAFAARVGGVIRNVHQIDIGEEDRDSLIEIEVDTSSEQEAP
jgi:hypothetical protein